MNSIQVIFPRRGVLYAFLSLLVLPSVAQALIDCKEMVIEVPEPNGQIYYNRLAQVASEWTSFNHRVKNAHTDGLDNVFKEVFSRHHSNVKSEIVDLGVSSSLNVIGSLASEAAESVAGRTNLGLMFETINVVYSLTNLRAAAREKSRQKRMWDWLQAEKDALSQTFADFPSEGQIHCVLLDGLVKMPAAEREQYVDTWFKFVRNLQIDFSKSAIDFEIKFYERWLQARWRVSRPPSYEGAMLVRAITSSPNPIFCKDTKLLAGAYSEEMGNRLNKILPLVKRTPMTLHVNKVILFTDAAQPPFGEKFCVHLGFAGHDAVGETNCRTYGVLTRSNQMLHKPLGNFTQDFFSAKKYLQCAATFGEKTQPIQ